MQDRSMIFGEPFSGEITPLSQLTSESGNVIVEGKVFDVDHRHMNKANTWVLRFDITDYAGSICVTSFMTKEDARPIINGIEKDMWLQIRGKVTWSRYEDDLVLQPFSIRSISKPPRLDNAERKRVELRLHTKMSMMDGLTDVTEAIEQAARWGHSAIGITDHCVVQAFPKAMYAARKAGIKVLYGCEMNSFTADSSQSYHITVFARNDAGLKLLYHLVSDSHLKYFDRRPRIPKSTYIGHHAELLLGSGGSGGELFQAVVENRKWEDLMHIACVFDFLEIEPICNYRHLVPPGIAEDDEKLQEINLTIVRLGDALGIPVVATGNVHFLNPEDEISRRVLLSATGRTEADCDLPLYFKTTAEMLDEFSYLGSDKCSEVVATNPNLIADLCDEISPLSGELYFPTIDGSASELEDLVRGKLHALYGAHPPHVITDRLDKELSFIRSHHTDVMFIASKRLVDASKAKGYPVGNRGLIGSSLAAFLAGITDTNPLPAHYRCPECGHTDFAVRSDCYCGADLPGSTCPSCGTPYEKDGNSIPWEPLFGLYGDKIPDIDLNFSRAYQEKAIAHCESIFGKDHVFHAGTIGTVSARTAYGYVRKYLADRNLSVTKSEVRRLANGCRGVKRTTGQHPGGLVIVPENMDIHDFCPVQHPANDPNSDVITTHFEYYDLEQTLLKLDILGHDDSTMLKQMADLTGIAPSSIPLDDPETMQIFRSPEPLGLPKDDPIIGKNGTLGIPEFGTSFVRQMLLDTEPADFDDLVRVAGLAHSVGTWFRNAQDLILSGTASLKEVISTRDDILLYLTHMGIGPNIAFKIMEAVRKGRVAKFGLKEGWEDLMDSVGIPQWYIKSLKEIVYLFPRAHAVAYVMSSYRIAWGTRFTIRWHFTVHILIADAEKVPLIRK